MKNIINEQELTLSSNDLNSTTYVKRSPLDEFEIKDVYNNWERTLKKNVPSNPNSTTYVAHKNLDKFGKITSIELFYPDCVYLNFSLKRESKLTEAFRKKRFHIPSSDDRFSLICFSDYQIALRQLNEEKCKRLLIPILRWVEENIGPIPCHILKEIAELYKLHDRNIETNIHELVNNKQ